MIESFEPRDLLTPTLSLPASVDVAEDVTAATNSDVEIATFTVTDADMVDISSGNENGHFYLMYDGVSTASLYVSALNPLDFESASSHVLTIDAWDMESNSATGSLTVYVLDVAEAPTFTNAPFAFTVSEDAASSTSVGTVTATDPQNDLSMFSILAGDPNGDFSIDSSGQITVQGTLDFESTPSYTLTVEVMDMGGNSATTSVTIDVFQANSAPEFDAASFAFVVSESIADGTIIGLLPATDSDGDLLSYAGGNGPFYVASDGTLRAIAPEGQLSAGDILSFTATVSDFVDSDTATVTITVVSAGGSLVANDDYASGETGSSFAIDVLANDLGSGLSIDSATGTDGTVTMVDSDADGYADLINLLVSDPSITSTQIQYTARDIAGNTAIAMVFVALQAPTANTKPRLVESLFDNPLKDARIYQFDYFIGQPTVGSVYLAPDPEDDGYSFRLTPNAHFDINSGGVIYAKRPMSLADATRPQVQLGVTVIDEHGDSDSAQVWINFKQPVKAVADSIAIQRLAADTKVDSPISVLINDTADPFRTLVETHQNPGFGTIQWDSNNLGFFTYQAVNNDPASFPFADTFKYRLVDTATGIWSDEVTVSLTFSVKPPPTLDAVADTVTATIDATKTEYDFALNILTNDTYPAGTTGQKLSDGRFGTVTLNGDGTFKYTVNNPNQLRASITDTFSYQLTNGGMTDTAYVDIRFEEPTPVVQNPVTQRPPQFTAPYYVFTYSQLQNSLPTPGTLNATDPDGDALSFELVRGHPNWLTMTSSGPTSVNIIRETTVAPPADGVYSFEVDVTDSNLSPTGGLQRDRATVYVVVGADGGPQSPTFVATNAGGPAPYTVTVNASDLATATNGRFATGKVVQANDPTLQAVTYMVLAPSDANFSSPIQVNPSTGEISVTGGVWDTGTQTVDVMATDPDGHIAITQLQVTLANVGNYTAKLFVTGQGDAEVVAGNDISQGTIGDCWFLSTLGALADRSPDTIRSMVQENGGQYFVRFFRRATPADPLTPVWITVAFDLAGDAGAAIGADIDANNNVEVWVRVIERGFIQLLGGPSHVPGGHAAMAYEMITGYPPPTLNLVTNSTKQVIINALNIGRLVFVHTLNNPVLPAGLVPEHQYQVMGFVDQSSVDPVNTYVRLRNPHGSNDVTINLDDLLRQLKVGSKRNISVTHGGIR